MILIDESSLPGIEDVDFVNPVYVESSSVEDIDPEEPIENLRKVPWDMYGLEFRFIPEEVDSFEDAIEYNRSCDGGEEVIGIPDSARSVLGNFDELDEEVAEQARIELEERLEERLETAGNEEYLRTPVSSNVHDDQEVHDEQERQQIYRQGTSPNTHRRRLTGGQVEGIDYFENSISVTVKWMYSDMYEIVIVDDQNSDNSKGYVETEGEVVPAIQKLLVQRQSQQYSQLNSLIDTIQKFKKSYEQITHSFKKFNSEEK